MSSSHKRTYSSEQPMSFHRRTFSNSERPNILTEEILTEDAPLLTTLFERPPSSTFLISRDELESTEAVFGVLETVDEHVPLPAYQSTLIGSTVFLLYHVVFCLAQAATITRPHASVASTGLLAKTAALGIVTGGPVMLFQLAQQVPALYPASDLFVAPFLAQLAVEIDQVLFERGLHNDDAVFLATFSVVTGAGFLLAGLLCILAARVKVANLGAFLPYSVLCGFFTTIGILMWTLGFAVDTGHSIPYVVMSCDLQLIGTALLHHIPSVMVGVIMHLYGPKSPFLVIRLVVATIVFSYLLLWVTNTSLEQAQELHWFFASQELTTSPTTSYGPPWPFGVWVALLEGKVVLEACQACLPTILALAFLYLVRCSLHSAALKKNVPHVTRKQPQPQPQPPMQDSEANWNSIHNGSNGAGAGADNNKLPITKRKEPLTLAYILEYGYGYSQIVAALAGGIPVAPSIAASLTLFQLGAETPPPQYGSCLLLAIFYVTDFSLVQYLPKPAVSCLMVLAGLDMCRNWLVGSYSKTKHKAEWMVGPILVVLAFSIGMLTAIFCGIACSTFIFVANFYRSGAVKYVGNGLTLRSTVERGIKESHWLDQNTDLIQILVVQNYLFFGNAQSVLTYIMTMFEDELQPTSPLHKSNYSTTSPYQQLQTYTLPPKPKYLIVDFTLISGMDTSAVDVLREIIVMCQENRCKLFLAGLNPTLKAMLLYAGVKPEPGAKRWAYASDLESALAKAEDGLLTNIYQLEDKDKAESSQRTRHRSASLTEDGFIYALQKIDEQHGLTAAKDLAGFRERTVAFNLEPGDILTREGNGDLYFVETGLMRVQRSSNSSYKFTLPTLPTATSLDPTSSIGHLNARSNTVGRVTALWKEFPQHTEQTFRLARIGQGWIIGGIEAANGMRRPGTHVAMSKCRLHHLPYSAIKEVEDEDPKLAMHLYKMLSHLATKRQEMTIEQLGQHLRIMNNPVPRLRGGGKSELARLQIMAQWN